MSAVKPLVHAIEDAKQALSNYGIKTQQDEWHSSKIEEPTLELLNHSIKAIMPETLHDLVAQCKPNLPWAEDQFNERIGGQPLNPGFTYKYWPFFKNYADDKHRDTNEQFSHTYMERFWPRYASETPNSIMAGIRYEYGDFSDVLNLLKKSPTTRQAYLPIWFPEDTGTLQNQRVPCTLGYHFIIRNQYLHMTYYIRSCDFIRHLRDDIYMAIRLAQYIAEELSVHFQMGISPGVFTMHIVSLHVFYNERGLLKLSKT